MMEKRVLVTGAGGPGGVNVTRALRLADEPIFLLGTDSSRYYIFLAETDARELVPRAAEADAYLGRLREVIERYDIGFVLPTNGVEIRLLTERRHEVPARLFLPRPETVKIAHGKYRSYRIWSKAGLPVPRTYLIENPADVDKVFEVIETRPVWVRGSGIPGIGIGVASLPCRKPEHAKAWVDHYAGWGKFIASEYLPGDNLTWASLWRHGELICSQGRRRISYVIPHVSPSGVTGAPAVCHTIHRADINEIGVKAMLAVDERPHGVFFVDFKCDAADHPKITEVNGGRFGTTAPHFYAKAGFNLPHLMIKLAYGEDIGPIPKFDVLPPDLYWIRTLDCGPILISLNDIERCVL